MVVFICVYVLSLALSWRCFRWERKVFYPNLKPNGPGILGAILHYLDLLHLILGAVGTLLIGIVFWFCLLLDVPFFDQLVMLAGPFMLWWTVCTGLFDPEPGFLLLRMFLALVLLLFWVFPIRRLLVVITLLKRPSTLSQKILLPLYPLIVYWPESLFCLFAIHLLVALDC